MRRAKELLLVIAAGVVFTLCAPPAPLRAAPQAGSAAAALSRGTARGANEAKKGKADAQKGGKKNGANGDATKAAGGNATPTPPPAGTPAEAGTNAQATATPTPTDTPAEQQTPLGKAGEAGAQTDTGADFAATARKLLNDWGLLAGLVATALGVVALAVYTLIKLRGRVSYLEDQLDALNSHLRRGDKVGTQVQTAARVSQVAAAETSDGKAAVKSSAPEVKEPEQAADVQPHTLAGSVADLAARVEALEGQLQSLVAAGGTPPSEEEARDADEAEAPPPVRPPQKVTVDKMVEWAQGAGLKLEAVKATVGLFGNFGPSDEGDNWLVTADGDHYLFPRVKRFESGSHFKSDYLDYYDCDQPSSGTVVIDRPATMSSDQQGGWKLVNKGKLSVIAS